MEDSRYIYASGYIRALECKLLSPRVLRQLIDSENEEALLRGLSSTRYAGNSSAELERNLAVSLKNSIFLTRKLLLDECLKEITGLKYDFFNISALLSARHSNAGTEPALFEDEGFVPTGALRAAVYEGSSRGVPAYMLDSIAEAEKRFARTSSMFQMELGLEKEYLKTLHVKCEEAKNIFFTGFSRMVSDLRNITAFLRYRLIRPGTSMREAMAETGSQWSRELGALDEADNAGVSALLARTPYSGIVSEGLSRLRRGGALAGVEAMGAKLLLDFLGKSRFVTMGPEPVFSYLWAVSEEIKSLRIISAGKKAGLPAGVMAERIPLLS